MKSRLSRRLAPLAALTLLGSAALTTTAHAQITAFTVPNPVAVTSFNNSTAGYTFTVGATAISVTDLGVYDLDSNGLAQSYLISIWNGSGTLLGSGTVPSGTAATLDSVYRYVSLGGSPVALAANTTYTIGAYFPFRGLDFPPPPSDSAPIAFSSGSILPGSGVTLGASRSTPGNAFPTGDTFGIGHYMTPNFKFTLSSGSVAPEPGTLALLLLGSTLIAAKRRSTAKH